MGKILWKKAVKIIAPHIVKIITPRGSGTGFLCAYNEDRTICGIATAAHVVDQSHYWEEPIRIQHHSSGKTRFLRAADRLISLDIKLDTAVILFPKRELPLPNTRLKYISERRHLEVGVEIGWVGFPAVSPKDLCFFTGRNSCWLEEFGIYLVDGVAINGVSGGPAFYPVTKDVTVIGSVSAYLPNRVGTTPGLAMISDVEQYLKMVKTIKDLDEARKKEISTAESKEKKQNKT